MVFGPRAFFRVFFGDGGQKSETLLGPKWCARTGALFNRCARPRAFFIFRLSEFLVHNAKTPKSYFSCFGGVMPSGGPWVRELTPKKHPKNSHFGVRFSTPRDENGRPTVFLAAGVNPPDAKMAKNGLSLLGLKTPRGPF